MLRAVEPRFEIAESAVNMKRMSPGWIQSIADKQNQRANDFVPNIESKLLPPKTARETLSKLLGNPVCSSNKLAPNAAGVNGISLLAVNDGCVLMEVRSWFQPVPAKIFTAVSEL